MWPCTAKMQWTKGWIKIKFSAEAFALRGSNVKSVHQNHPAMTWQPRLVKQTGFLGQDWLFLHQWSSLSTSPVSTSRCSKPSPPSLSSGSSGRACPSNSGSWQTAFTGNHVGCKLWIFQGKSSFKKRKNGDPQPPIPLMWSSYFVANIATKIVFFYFCFKLHCVSQVVKI